MDADITNAALRAIRRILRAADQGGRRLAAETGLVNATNFNTPQALARALDELPSMPEIDVYLHYFE